MDNTTILNLFEAYIPSKQWTNIVKVSVKYKENRWMRWVVLFNSNKHKNYFLKVTYKNGNVKFISIPQDVKDEIKSQVMAFNFHISSLK
jgi:hypothetical protein